MNHKDAEDVLASQPEGGPADKAADDMAGREPPLAPRYRQDPDGPVINAPAVVIWLALGFLAMHLAVQYLQPETANQIIMALAFIPLRFIEGGDALPGGQIARVTSFVTYGFLHGDWMHLAMNSFWMLAFGSVAARRLGAVRFLAFSALAAAVAASFSLALSWGQSLVLVGASGAIAGQMAIAIRLIFAHGGTLRTSMMRDVSQLPPEPLARLFTNRAAVTFLVIWLTIDILFANSGLMTDGRVAWEAHLGGFLAGLLGFAMFDPLRKRAARDVS
ncbi:MAG: rhomboid family intramembrane serine protease [Anderseniella sp.]|nr:rhomboid family intramembrane serine protease [Anderseniella sp.]